MAARAPTITKPAKTPPELPGKEESRPVATIEQIRQRAYELYLERGNGAGSETDDWLQAEAELNPHRE
jgi:hypothetical protein